jgi:hypothetical protein
MLAHMALPTHVVIHPATQFASYNTPYVKATGKDLSERKAILG